MSDRDFEHEAHEAAMAHLGLCEEALEGAEGITDPEKWPPSPAMGPYDGCEICRVREALFAAWPIIEEATRVRDALVKS